ncbi:AIM24 family protein [Paenibacillus eucommiae]|uniref:Uncharacterized protein (AIM24 family) n=1 Tax=Paenibacillus eucommiae TaxID=1355755 RepID=A0ABS4ITH6_9BACL|nr:AIM24 family protein [Paenibacillus eucommiae]MBP1990878.1 uncharacterized protein (AIM24 family) [Paenibacillus eucommiae]
MLKQNSGEGSSIDISFEQAQQRNFMATLSVEKNESLYVLHPSQIVVFQGASYQREDSFMRIPNMYRKKKFLHSRIRGPASLMIGLPDQYCITTLPIEAEDDLLFEFKNVLFYTEGIKYHAHVQSVRNAVITRDLVKMRFEGPGTLGLLTAGPLYTMELHPVKPVYIDMACLVAFPQKADIRLCVYGNTLASQNMNYQWEMTGHGSVLLQPCKPNKALDEQMENDSFIRRILREVIPFGGIFIR